MAEIPDDFNQDRTLLCRVKLYLTMAMPTNGVHWWAPGPGISKVNPEGWRCLWRHFRSTGGFKGPADHSWLKEEHDEL